MHRFYGTRLGVVEGILVLSGSMLPQRVATDAMGICEFGFTAEPASSGIPQHTSDLLNQSA